MKHEPRVDFVWLHHCLPMGDLNTLVGFRMVIACHLHTLKSWCCTHQHMRSHNFTGTQRSIHGPVEESTKLRTSNKIILI